ncbi:hypothetical protein SORBI_3002G114200 [Sorghum bicolor]|uniref:GAGA-binding transcriptional activator n=1 Tax=Sorghum bicolor TaxID=4558 RepID=A0A1B6QAK9_SORBI|nr:hypothetical protein SORBI_3002G114200 [Sorghum bicolor]
MDDDDGSLGTRNWGFYDTVKGNLGLQVMSSVPPDRDTKSLLPNGAFLQHHGHHNAPHQLHMQQHSQHSVAPLVLHHQRPPEQKVLHSRPIGPAGHVGHPGHGGHIVHYHPTSYGMISDAQHTLQMMQPSLERGSKKTVGMVINGIELDLANIPTLVCSCTGAPQQCYRWGAGGWQSACCTTSISTYPLPMNTKRRGARISGRKMSQGAFKKVLEKLAGEGYNLANPIDLKTFWAKHRTNKFVTIR